jgi:hypothetical protein
VAATDVHILIMSISCGNGNGSGDGAEFVLFSEGGAPDSNDAEILRYLASVSPPDQPRQVRMPDAEDPDWCVVAEQHGVVVTADLVSRVRAFFESIASLVPGTEYAGWHASARLAD